MREPGRILVVRPDRIGDVVLATPILRALRKRFPSAFVAALVRPYTAGVLEGNPHLDELIIDDPDGADAGTSGFWRQTARLRAQRFDTGLMLLPSRRYAWMLFFAGVRTRIGTSRKAYHALTFMRTLTRNNYIPPRHEADYCLDHARAIGADDDGLEVEVFLNPEERHQARERLGPGRMVGVHPGSGASAPNWRIEHYVTLAAELLDRHSDIRVVLTGGPGEERLTPPFSRLPADRVVDLVGQLNLRETMAVISQLDVLVSASTGTMHLAAGLRVPTVSLFCPLASCAPALWGPQGNRAEVILPHDGYCQTECPGDPHVCRFEGGIAVDVVLQATAAVLA